MSKVQFAQAIPAAGAWKLPANEVWNLPERPTNEVRFDITTTGSGWNLITGIKGLAVDRDGKVWGWRALSNPKESGYVQEGTVSIAGQKVRAFTSSQLFEREDGSLCDVAILYLCRKENV